MLWSKIFSSRRIFALSGESFPLKLGGETAQLIAIEINIFTKIPHESHPSNGNSKRHAHAKVRHALKRR